MKLIEACDVFDSDDGDFDYDGESLVGFRKVYSGAYCSDVVKFCDMHNLTMIQCKHFIELYDQRDRYKGTFVEKLRALHFWES